MIMDNNWYLYCKKADFSAISDKFNISPMLARILVNRGIDNDADIEYFLHGTTQQMHDPFLLNGMREGVSIALDTVRSGGKIRIIGDYDVDGICAAYILKRTMEIVGGNVDVRLPDRILDGYGMNESMAVDAANDGVALIITCDNGVSSYDAVRMAVKSGIRVIITDHHIVPGEIPPADVLIDAKQDRDEYPFKEICGAGVAYKFAQAFLSSTDISHDEASSFLSEMLQYAGMATIADIVSLKGENHIFAKYGIEALRKTSNPGLLALMEVKGIDPANIMGYHIGFVLGPSINSAGRLRHAKIAFDLFDDQDPSHAFQIANELNQLNEERKNLTMDQTHVAEEILKDDPDIISGKKKIIVLYLPDCHESVAGIIAGKLKDEYGKPALVITDSEDGLKGSARSTDDYNIVEALKGHQECFKKVGGHAKAAGFTLNCDPLYLSELLNSDPETSKITSKKKIWIDMRLPFRYITEEFINELDYLEPFGMDNDRPRFAEKNIILRNCHILGKNQNVIKVDMINEDGDRMEGVKFGHGQDMSELYARIQKAISDKGDAARFSILFYPNINEFRGVRSPQAIIEEIRPQ